MSGIYGKGTSKGANKPTAPRHTRARGGSGARAPAVRQPGAAGAAGAGSQATIATTVSGLGFELVDVERAARGLLRVFIDRIPGRTYSLPGEFITVDDCEQVTRQLQYVLEVDGLDYARLEVSSPGLDRPLKTEADFERFAGQAVQLVLKAPFQGRKNWQGVLGRGDAKADGSKGFSLVLNDGKTEQVFGFALDEVRDARLVPVVDFKGRKPSANAGAAGPAGVMPALTEGAAAAAAPANDGGK